ncbi:hypothetical protein LEP1GSC170_3477 [Leptospira interrogans serovar Bataviae str. HAI135]|nr:hypothetical protein LEP1GSC170_3477 [Leptospira interrogans serovar Bataviae str. HAI135]
MIHKTNSNLLLERKMNFMTKLEKEKKRYMFLGRELLFFRFF